MPNVEEVARLRVSITGATEAQIQRLEEQIKALEEQKKLLDKQKDLINALEEQMLKKVTAEGNSTTGTYRPFGLDCSGFADWVFYNISGGSYILGHGGGAHAQHIYCTPITWDEAIPGDLVFYPEDTHVGIVCGFDSGGNVQIIHCASGANNVVVTGKSGFTTIARPKFYSS